MSARDSASGSSDWRGGGGSINNGGGGTANGGLGGGQGGGRPGGGAAVNGGYGANFGVNTGTQTGTTARNYTPPAPVVRAVPAYRPPTVVPPTVVPPPPPKPVIPHFWYPASANPFTQPTVTYPPSPNQSMEGNPTAKPYNADNGFYKDDPAWNPRGDNENPAGVTRSQKGPSEFGNTGQNNSNAGDKGSNGGHPYKAGGAVRSALLTVQGLTKKSDAIVLDAKGHIHSTGPLKSGPVVQVMSNGQVRHGTLKITWGS